MSAKTRLAALPGVRVSQCRRKVDYRTEAEAWVVAGRHFACFKCLEGGRVEPYPCPVDPGHWHIGHAPSAGEVGRGPS